jgi:hypothetical protein
MSKVWISSMVCALALASCGSPVKVNGDRDTDTEDTSSTDAVEDVVEDGVTDSPVDVPGDMPPDTGADTIEPDVPAGCISAGCRVSPDGALSCCDGLTQVSSCPPWDSSCSPVYHCVHCGNGTCEPHEAPWSCSLDCAEGCVLGSTLGYACSQIEVYDCSCLAPPCRVECDVTMGGTRWVNTCTGESYGFCSLTEHAVCLHIGTDSEGWYFIGPMGG